MFAPRASAVTLLVALLLAPCVGVCSGWMMSPHDRMACCADKEQGEADSCCASGEGRQNADLLAGLALAALPPAAAVDAHQIGSMLTSPQIFPKPWDNHDHILSDSHRYVLLSVFLI